MPSSDLSSAIDPAADEQAQATLLQTFLATAHHFFGSFVQLFAGVRDPRCPELIRYPLAALLFAGVLTPALLRIAVQVCLSAAWGRADRSIIYCGAMAPRPPNSKRSSKSQAVRTGIPLRQPTVDWSRTNCKPSSPA